MVTSIGFRRRATKRQTALARGACAIPAWLRAPESCDGAHTRPSLTTIAIRTLSDSEKKKPPDETSEGLFANRWRVGLLNGRRTGQRQAAECRQAARLIH